MVVGRRWRVRDFGDDVTLEVASSLAPSEDVERACDELERLLRSHDSAVRRSLFEAYASLRRLGGGEWRTGTLPDVVQRDLAAATRAGRLLVRRTQPSARIVPLLDDEAVLGPEDPVEPDYELAFQVTCEVTGYPLPLSPYEVWDAQERLVQTGRTDRHGNTVVHVGVKGVYKVIAFPNRKQAVSLLIFDANNRNVPDAEVTLQDSEGIRHTATSDRRGLASFEDVACGRVTVALAGKSATVYLDSEHRGPRQVRIAEYFRPRPRRHEFSEYEQGTAT
jgi:hypothetical protein